MSRANPADPLLDWKVAIGQLGDRLERDYLEPVMRFAGGFGIYGSSTRIGYEIPLGGRVGKIVGSERQYARKVGLFGLTGPRVIVRDLADIEAEFRVEIEAWLKEQERKSDAVGVAIPSRDRLPGMKLRLLHGVLGFLCIAFVGLIVIGNTVLNSAPGGLGYFKRGDVAAMLALGAVLAVVLLWASAGDSDRRRAIGSIASGTMTGLLLGTVSIPVLAVPLSVIGCFRLPESRAAKIPLLVLIPLGAVAGVALPYLGRALITV